MAEKEQVNHSAELSATEQEYRKHIEKLTNAIGNLGMKGRARMRDIVNEFNPSDPREREELWDCLRPNMHVNEDHATALAVGKATTPELKAALLDVFVQEQTQDEGNPGGRARAVGMLAQANAVELPNVTHYDENFVFRQYDKEKNVGDAWRIANTMNAKRDRIVHPYSMTEEGHNHQKKEWAKREKESFVRYTNAVLKANETAIDESDDSELKFIFNRMKHREDNGFAGESISKLARRVAERVIERDVKTENYEEALQHAVESHMSMRDLSALRDQIQQRAPRAIHSFDIWLTQFISRATIGRAGETTSEK